MASTSYRLTVALAALVALATLPGCFLMESNVTIKVDGSADLAMRVGISKALADMGDGESSPLDDIPKDLPEGWTVTPLADEQWEGFELNGRAGAGEQLIPPMGDEGAGSMDVKVETRLFSTDYVFDATMAPGEGSMPAEETANVARNESAPRIVFVQDTEGESDPDELDPGPDLEALGSLLSGGSGAPRITFTVDAPGFVVETDGEEDAETGRIAWDVRVEDLMSGKFAEGIQLHLRTRLLNWQNIGRLADALAAATPYDDCGELVADYVRRGLIPNPPRVAPVKATVDAEAYASAIGIVASLEELVGEDVVGKVVSALGVNHDGTTGKQLKDLERRLGATDPAVLQGAIARAVAQQLGAE